MTRQYDNYADLITFSRSSGGTALRPISYGTELVTNGTFDTGDFTGFSVAGGAWSVVSNQAICSDTTSSNNFLVWQDGASAGKIYLGSVDVISNDASGTSYIQWGLDTNTRVISPSAGTYTQIFTGSVELFRANVNASSGSLVLDNISVKEVFFDQPNAPLTLFNHPAGIPRIEYDADGNRLGLLIEESRTNLITYSEDFTDSYWSKLSLGNGSAPVLTENYAAAPDGTNTATRLQASISSDDPVGGDFSLLQRAFSTSGSHTSSIWVKSNTGENQEVYFRIASNQAVTVTPEWTRISATSASTTTYLTIGVRDDLGDPNVDILIWGAQYEAGAFSTSYIPTSGATATRAADAASIPVSAFGYNQSEGTLFAEVRAEDTDSSSGNPFYEIGTATSNYIRLDRYSLGFAFRVRANNVTTVNAAIPTGEPNTTDFHKVSASYLNDDFAYTYNGNTPGTDSSGTVPSVINTLNIADGTFNGHIKSIKYFPRRLTNSQLVEITT